MTPAEQKIAIIGLGYVGLPLAVEFAKKYRVVGYDIQTTRIAELMQGIDTTKEVDTTTLRSLIVVDFNRDDKGLYISSDEAVLYEGVDIFILTVPTPVDEHKIPDLSQLLTACKLVATKLVKGNIVIFESTVYPGCTEDDCVPILEQYSGLKYNEDFFVGYSPERINPGDKVHTLTSVMKVTSGSTLEIAQVVDNLYKTIITAGTHLAASIKVAEASKAIENAQRDVNISFVNELALIFDRMGIDTSDALEAAGTKYNFLQFKPGLVGGHCIGVDPYYLSYKANALGIATQVINSGRQINEQMGAFVAGKIDKALLERNKGIEEISVSKGRVLILGFTFKENCPDIRNTGVRRLYEALNERNFVVDIFDPYADSDRVLNEYGISLQSKIEEITKYVAVVHAVAHEIFRKIDYAKWKDSGVYIFDIKGVLPREIVDGRL